MLAARRTVGRDAQPSYGRRGFRNVLYPIYGGIILLAGVVVGCTSVVCERLEQLKAELKDKNKNDTEDI